MSQRPSITCRQLPAFAPARWDSVRAAFAGAAPLALGQAWRASPEERFQPGVVRAGWQADALWALAELADSGIVSIEDRFNEPAFLSSDVFEVFLRPQGQEAYYEFHVTPGNGRLQLRYPDENAVEEVRSAMSEEAADPFVPYKVAAELFQSWTRVDVATARWEVLVRIPVMSVSEAGGPPATRASHKHSTAREARRAGEVPLRFDASFCRYDYAPGIREPVISSTSAHLLPSFHRPYEWAELILV